MAAGGSDEDGPPMTITEQGSDNFIKHSRVDVGVLIEDNPVKIQSSKAAFVFGSVKPNPGPVRKIDTKLGLVISDSRDGSGKLLDVAPGDVLGLTVLRCDIGEPSIGVLGKSKGCPYQFVDTGNSFSGTLSAVAYKA